MEAPVRGRPGRRQQAEVKSAMVIEFLCPQGHKIRCADDRAGKPAKCPKCGVKFYVPGPDDGDAAESGAWATAPAETSNSPGSTGSIKEQIEFLCPNGHRVWAPIGLQGRPGQCPECGSKFHIPTLADYAEIPLDILPTEDSVVNLDPLGGLQGNGSPQGKGSSRLARSDLRGPASPAPAAGPDKMVRLLADLVADLPEGAVIELLTTDGQKYLPARWARSLCDSTRLAFSTNSQDETHSLVILPWSSIARIEIHGLKQLPVEFRR
ncbi:MAG: hypothetical protein ACYC6Y_28090 [Thermoguttaceae bacterium]